MSGGNPEKGPNGARLIQGTFGVGNLEAVILENGGPNGRQLVHYWRDDSIVNPIRKTWNRGEVISTFATSSASLIQSTYGSPGNFEILVLEGTNVVHYWRDNSNSPYRWNRGSVVSSRATGAPSLIQGDYISQPGNPGNFEAVILEGSNLVHYWRENSDPNRPWYSSAVVTSRATGPGSLIQSTYVDAPGGHRNLELVVQEGSDLVHYWRSDSANGKPWNRGSVITSKLTANGPGTFFQGAYDRAPGQTQANFEVVAQEGRRIVHYYRDNSPAGGKKWHPSVAITTNAAGPASFIEGRYGPPGTPGNFELIVVDSPTNLTHYWRHNAGPRPYPWRRSVVVDSAAIG